MNYLESYLEFVTSIRPTLTYNDDPVDCIYEDLEPSPSPSPSPIESTESNISVSHASSDEPLLIALQDATPTEDYVVLSFNADYKDTNTSHNISCDVSPSNDTTNDNCLPSEKLQLPRKMLKCNTCKFKTRSKRDLKKHYMQIHDLMLVRKAGASDKMNLRYNVEAHTSEPTVGNLEFEAESVQPIKQDINSDFPLKQQIMLSLDGSLLEVKTNVEGNLTVVDLERAAGVDGFVKLDDLVAVQTGVMGEQA